MKVFLKPLYSQLNTLKGCPLGCQEKCQVAQVSDFKVSSKIDSCSLSIHQAKTYAAVTQSNADIIFNTAATGDGKSLAAYLPALLNPGFRIMSLYPTIELVADQEKQIKGDIDRPKPFKGYCHKFGVDGVVKTDTLYGAELARRIEQVPKGSKFKELLLSLKRKHIILTNPDIFHLATHFRYQNPAYNRAELPIAFARNPDLYVADEFHIFGVHQETAILNSLLLIRHTRSQKRPIKFLFTSATPKTSFIEQLGNAGFQVETVTGNYASEKTSGFRSDPILQKVALEFVQLPSDPEYDSLTWLVEQADTILQLLDAEEKKGRGLIILNSVAQVGRAVRRLQERLPESRVKIREISGRIDQATRKETQQELENAEQSVLVIATSAVDVGVDFKIHLLIFETSDSATFIQRLGRLGRHEGFGTYNAVVLLPARTPWIKERLEKDLVPGDPYDRAQFREIIETAFDLPKEFEQYRAYWGALQAQGMLFSMGKDGVMQSLKERMTDDLRRVYGEQLDKKRGHWYALDRDKEAGAAVQQELLRFRGGSELQAAVWDDSRFYAYDLLRLLPYAEVDIIERETFLGAAQNANHAATEFDDRYIQVYLKIQQWLDKRIPDFGLECDLDPERLRPGTLTCISKLRITGHPSFGVSGCLKKQRILAFLVVVNRHQKNSHWDVSNTLHLSPMFGLYRLTDADDQAYACAFNQDALLLECLKWRLKPCENTKPYIY